VVAKLFQITAADIAVFGRKDAQQAIIIKRMVRDCNFPVHIDIAPTVRESDGVAMSSRNAYLTEEERKEAALIYEGLQRAELLFEQGERRGSVIRESIVKFYSSATRFTPEYIEIVDTTALDPITTIQTTVLVAVACRTDQSRTRLIDNIVLGGTL
jgi:pantoate--beta-alanine ligase